MSDTHLPKQVSRRDFLKLVGVASGAAVLAGCAPQTPPPTTAPTAVPTVAPAPTTAPVATTAPVPTVGPTPDANGCVVDWLPTYPPFEKYDPAIEIQVPFRAGLNYPVEGDSATNNPDYNLVVEQLGLKYVAAWEAPNSEYYPRLNNDLAAGTLPDAFRVGNPRLGQFIDIGAVEDITDVFEATASDLVKDRKGYPDSSTWNGVKRNGRIFGVAYLEDGIGSDNLAFIRQDWLDAVGLAVPVSVDDVTAAARAIKEAGLCEFPIGACVAMVTWQMAMDPIFGAFGSIPTWWLKGDDGTLRYGSIDPGIKDGLTVLNQWYQEGLINPDFVNMDESMAGDAVMAGQTAIFYAPWWIGHGLLPDLYAAFPEAKISVIQNPAGPTGRTGRAGTELKGNAMVFRAGLEPEKIEAMIKHLNWCTEIHVNWEEYQQYGEAFMGASFARGYEWDLDANCNVVLGLMPDGEWLYQQDLLWGYRGGTYPDWQGEIFRDMATWLEQDQSTLNMAQKFILGLKAKVDDMVYYNYAYDTLAEVIPNAFLGADTEAITAVKSDLLDLESTAMLEFITGARPLDDFDTFVQEWKDRGGDAYTQEVNAWAAANA